MRWIEKISALRFFQVTALLFGLYYIAIVPPFQVPDEPDHFERAFSLASGQFFGKQLDNRLVGLVPNSVIYLEEIYWPYKFNYEEKGGFKKWFHAKSIPLKPEIYSYQDIPNTGLYPVTVYLPQVLTVGVGKAFNIRPLYLLYLTRIITFLCWVWLISWAIRLMPDKQWLLALLALLPSSLFINASASGDVVTNGLAFVLLAFCYRMMVSEQANLGKRQVLWLFVGMGVLALNKFVYTPITLLVFLFPKRHFSSARHRNGLAVALGIWVIAVVAMWNLQTSELFIPKDLYNPAYKDQVTLNDGVNPKAQFEYILHHPLQYTKTLLISYVETAQATMAHYFGKFGWEQNYLPTWLVALLLLTTGLTSAQQSKFQLTVRAQSTLICSAIIMSIGLATTLYMMWSPVDNERILSLSGRYFIPILPLVWLAIPRRLKVRNYQYWVMGVVLVALTFGAICARARYY